MSKKDNLPLGVQLEFNDVDYWHKLSKTKIVPGTKLTEYEWMRRFMHESYAHNFDREDNSKNILKKKEQKQWATRNNNVLNRDVWNLANKSGKFAQLLHISEDEADKKESAWKKKFKSGDYDAAAFELIKESCEELGIKYNLINSKLLLRFNYRLKTLLSYIRADQRAQKKKCKVCKKTKSKTEFRKTKKSKNGYESICIECRGGKNE